MLYDICVKFRSSKFKYDKNCRNSTAGIRTRTINFTYPRINALSGFSRIGVIIPRINNSVAWNSWSITNPTTFSFWSCSSLSEIINLQYCFDLICHQKILFWSKNIVLMPRLKALFMILLFPVELWILQLFYVNILR